MFNGGQADADQQDPRVIWVGPRLSDIMDCEEGLFSGSITTYGLNGMLDERYVRTGDLQPMSKLVGTILGKWSSDDGQLRPNVRFNISYQESELCPRAPAGEDGKTRERLRVNHNNDDPLRDVFMFLTMADILHRAGKDSKRIWFMSYDPSTLDHGLDSGFMRNVLRKYLETLLRNEPDGLAQDVRDRITDFLSRRLYEGDESSDEERARNAISDMLRGLSGLDAKREGTSTWDEGTLNVALHFTSNVIRRHTLCLNDGIDLVRDIKDKTLFRKMCTDVGVPTIECLNIDPHEHAHTYQMLRKYVPHGTMVLQNISSSEGNRTYLVREPSDEDERRRTDARIREIMGASGTFILSRYRDPNIPVNVHAFISDDTVSITRPSVQIIDVSGDRLLNRGNDFPAFEQVRKDRPELVEQMNTYLEWICKALQGKGYRGIIGFDLLLGDKVELTEANPCFQPSSALLNKALAEDRFEHGADADSPYLRRVVYDRRERKPTEEGEGKGSANTLSDKSQPENRFEHGEEADQIHLRNDATSEKTEELKDEEGKPSDTPSGKGQTENSHGYNANEVGSTRCIRKGEGRKPSMQMLNIMSFYDVDLDTDDQEHARMMNTVIRAIHKRCHGSDDGHGEGRTLRLPMTTSDFRTLSVPFSRFIYRAPDHPSEHGYDQRDLRHQIHILEAHRRNIRRPLDLVDKLIDRRADLDQIIESKLSTENLRLDAHYASSLVNLAQHVPEYVERRFRKIVQSLDKLAEALEKREPSKGCPDREHLIRMRDAVIRICNGIRQDGTFRALEPVSNLDNPVLGTPRTEMGEKEEDEGGESLWKFPLHAEPGAYLFAITFRRNITSTQCDSLMIHPCLAAPSESWDKMISESGKAPRDRTVLAPLKIALMNEGARLTDEALEWAFPATVYLKSESIDELRTRNPSFEQDLRHWGDNRFSESPSMSFDAELPCETYDYSGRRMRGLPVKIPINNDLADYSPFSIDVKDGFILRHYGEELMDITRLESEHICREAKGGPVPIEAILSQEPGNLEVRQSHTCMHVSNGRGCKFCKYSSRRLGPSSRNIFDLEDIHDALSEDNITKKARSDLKFNVISLSIGGGTPDGTVAERTRRITSICEYLRESFENKRILLKCVPPNAHTDLDEYRHAGITSIMMNIELFDRRRATTYMPGKSVVPISTYMSTLRHAVNLWPLPGAVMSGIILGLEPDASFLMGIRHLASIGVSPVISIFHPLEGTELENMLPPTSEHIHKMYLRARNVCLECFVPLGPVDVMSQYDKVVVPDDRTAGMLGQGLRMRQRLNGGA